MRTLLFCLTIVVCSSCKRNVKYIIQDEVFKIAIVRDDFVSLPTITNEVLKANIIEYATTPDRFGKREEKLVYMESFTSGDTIIYRFYSALGVAQFIWPSVSAIFKLDSIYIGYRNLDNSDFEMPIEAVVGILAIDYPSIRKAYGKYAERKDRQKHIDYLTDGYVQAAFGGRIGRVDIWTLKFVDGRLVSRSVYSEVYGSTIYF